MLAPDLAEALAAAVRDPAQVERLLCTTSLREFVRQGWPVLEPGTPYLHGRVIEAICEHLEAVTAGQIRRLLINVPPGTAKSLLARVLAVAIGVCGVLLTALLAAIAVRALTEATEDRER